MESKKKNEGNEELKKVIPVSKGNTSDKKDPVIGNSASTSGGEGQAKGPTQKEIDEYRRLKKKQVQQMRADVNLQLEPLTIENGLLEEKVRNMELTIRQASVLDSYMESLGKIKEFNSQK